ncbi:MAG: type 1 glutamine amidotransferase [Xanthobacter sp.]
MSAPRLLVVEGNIAQDRAAQISCGGQAAGEAYAALLRELWPGAVTEICFPADLGAHLPNSAGLEGYDGIAITGSSLNIYTRAPEVETQIALIRTAFETGVPIFGSCWGLQLLTVAAGGSVRLSPKGREVGFGRRIRQMEHDTCHPLYTDKTPVFEAMTVHQDEVETLPEGAVLLATNDHSAVQATAFKAGRSTCWGVQYHPEYPFREMAAIFRRYCPKLIAEGFFMDEEEAGLFIADLEHLERDPGNKSLSWRFGIDEALTRKAVRTQELRNWIDHMVIPTRAARGRG